MPAAPIANAPTKSAYCLLCGKWPATGYVDFDNKNSGGRICEDCEAKYERNEQGRLILK
jgi:hypothetical protein